MMQAFLELSSLIQPFDYHIYHLHPSLLFPSIVNTFQLALYDERRPSFRLSCSACSLFYALSRLQLRSLAETAMGQRKALQAEAKIIQLTLLLTLQAGQTWQRKTVTRCSASGRARSCKYGPTKVTRMLTEEDKEDRLAQPQVKTIARLQEPILDRLRATSWQCAILRRSVRSLLVQRNFLGPARTTEGRTPSYFQQP